MSTITINIDAPGLPVVLAKDPSTGNIYIKSPDGTSLLGVLDGGIIDWSADAGAYLQSWFFGDNTAMTIGFGNNELIQNATQTELKHALALLLHANNTASLYTNNGGVLVSEAVTALARYIQIKIAATTLTHDVLLNLNAPNINLPNETASLILSTDASKNIKGLSTTTYPSLTELAYVKGVTSAMQTQLNSKLTTTLTSEANDDIIQRKSGSWVNRTLAQLWTDLKDLAVTLTNKTISLASNTLTGTKAEFNTACSDGDFVYTDNATLTDARSRKIFSYQNTTVPLTGTTAETILYSVLIPAGSIGANGKLMIDGLISSNSGAAANRTGRIYLNNTNDLTTPTQIGVNQLAGTNIVQGIQRRLVNKNSEALNESFPAGAAAASDVVNSTTALSTINYDTSVDMYLIYTGQLTNSADTINLNNIQIYIDKI